MVVGRFLRTLGSRFVSLSCVAHVRAQEAFPLATSSCQEDGLSTFRIEHTQRAAVLSSYPASGQLSVAEQRANIKAPGFSHCSSRRRIDALTGTPDREALLRHDDLRVTLTPAAATHRPTNTATTPAEQPRTGPTIRLVPTHSDSSIPS